ncbi:MAG: hypothetical protein ACR2JB_22290 [Bryobacteraceae bacterium]
MTSRGNTAAVVLSGHVSLQEVGLSVVNRFASGAVPPQRNAVVSGDAAVGSHDETLSAKDNLAAPNTVVRGSKLDYPTKARCGFVNTALADKKVRW